VIDASTSGNYKVILADNTISESEACGVFFGSGSLNNLQVTATGNTITGNGGGGIVFDSPCDTLTLIARDNTISGSANSGISTNSVIMTTVNMDLINNQMNSNTTSSGDGLNISHTGITFNLTALNNDFSNNDS
jgi:hypothetical protein